MAEKIKSRDNGLDLLRIICMAMVVGIHFWGWGGGFNEDVWSYNYFTSQIVYSFLLIAVNCFVLISGYYLCTSKFKLKKIVNLWLQVAFYSVGIYLIVSLVKGEFAFSDFIKSGLVVTFDRYWFFTVYFLLYLIFPFLNYAIKAMTQRVHFLCCAVLLTVFSIVPTFIYVVDFSQAVRGTTLIWFITLYMIASYIRLYVPKNCIKKRTAFLVYVLCCLLIVGERFLAVWITPHIFGRVVLDSYFYAYNSIVMVICSIAFLILFRQVDIKNSVANKAIAVLAPFSFAVYLIHEQDEFRMVLWGFLNPSQFHNSPFLVVYFFVCVLVIFLGCSGVEFVRQFVFEKCRINKLVGKICDVAEAKATKLLEKIPDKKSE